MTISEKASALIIGDTRMRPEKLRSITRFIANHTVQSADNPVSSYRLQVVLVLVLR